MFQTQWMTIDERPEALTRSLKLMAGLHRDTEAMLSGSTAKLSASQAKTEKMVRGRGRCATAIGTTMRTAMFAIENPET